MSTSSAVLATAALGLVIAGPCLAAADAYLKIDQVPGAAGPPEYVDVASFHWGVGRGIGSPTGGSADRESSAPSVSELTVTRQIDAASPWFKACAAKGCRIPRMELVTRKAGHQEVITNAVVSRYVSSGGDRPSESVSFRFAPVKVKFPWMPGERGAWTHSRPPGSSASLSAPGPSEPNP